MRKIISLFVLGVLLLLIVSAQPTNPWSASLTGVEKNTFSSLEDVFVKSNIICRPNTEVDLYIVDNNDDWQDGDLLEDVRGAPEPIVLVSSKIPLTDIWKSPDSGDYDIVVDCNKNGEYDAGDEVDDFAEAGFVVEAVAGTGKASRGSEDPGEHMWQYDPEALELSNVMMQINLLAEGEDVALLNLTLAASGSGDDTKIIALEVYVDENNNGNLDDAEILIGDAEPAFEEDNGEVTIGLDYFLEKGADENILIVYVMPESIEDGEFVVEVDSIVGRGGDSDSIIKFSGLPLKSGTKKVLPEKTCLGELNLDLLPNPAEPGETVIATFSGLAGCDGKEVSLRTNPCGSSSPQITGTCTLKNETCKAEFKAATTKTYHLCMDKNGDNDAVDFGEFTFQELIVKEPEEQETPINETGELNETTTEEEEEQQEETNVTPTGAVSGLEEITEAGSFFILLEVTLLLILFVLVMILFRLKPAAAPQEEEKEQPEEKKEKREKKEKKEKE